MPTAAAVNTNLQLELVVLSTARADKFYITLADHNLLIMVILKTNQALSISMFLQLYGAWAVNPKTGISGGALNMSSRALAEKEAIRTCEQGGQNAPCIIGAWVRNGCIAVAQGKTGKKLRTFYAIEDPDLAEPTALRKCQAAGAVQCKITTPEGCSLPKF